MPIINLDQPILDLHGEQVQFANPDKPGPKEVMTVKSACVFSLIVTMDLDRNITADQKYKLYALAQKLQNANGEIKLTSDEVVLVKERALHLLPVVSYGYLVDLLEEKHKKPSKTDKEEGDKPAEKP